MQPICLIDAKNFMFWNHYAHPELKGPEGEPTSVLYGCMDGLLSLSKRLPDTPIVFCWDGGGSTWRHRYLSGHKPAEKIQSKTATDWVGRQIAGSLRYLTSNRPKVAPPKPKPPEKPVGYKANRVEAEGSEKQEGRAVALSQIPELKRMMSSLGLKNFKIAGLEGDDLIGIMATAILKKQLFSPVIIYSRDSDFYQLLSNGIKILKNLAGEGLIFTGEEDVKRGYNVSADEWIKYRALTGDKSDNIPQLIQKVGPVRALKLLRAGVDASKGRHEVSQQAINALMDMTKGQLELDDFWPRLRKNYMACKILTCDDYKAPTEDAAVQSKIAELLDTLDTGMLLRDEKGKSEQAYREFCEWCVGHGMMDLRSRAGEFGAFV